MMDKSRIRNATPEPFRDLLLQMARSHGFVSVPCPECKPEEWEEITSPTDKKEQADG